MNSPDIKDALKSWVLVSAGLVFCAFVGKTFVQTSSSFVFVLLAALTVMGITFYSPKAALGFIVFSMLLSPKIPGMSIGPGSYQSSVVIRFDDLLLGIVFTAWIARTAILKPSWFLLSTPIQTPIFFFTSACVVSTMLAVMDGRVQPLRSFFFVLKYVEYYLLFFMTVNIVEDGEDIQRYLRYGWVTAMIVTLYGYIQVPKGERVTAPFEAPLGANPIEKAAASEPNTLGGYYVVVFSVLLSLFTQSDDWISLLSMGSFCFMLLPYFYTLSRSSYIGLAGSIAAHVLMTRRKRAALLFGVGFAAILFMMVPKLRNSVLERIAYTFTGRSGTETNVVYSVGSFGGSSVRLEGSAAARWFSWKRIVLTRFPQRPLFGWGVTGVGLSDTQYPLVLGETGLVGACLFSWMLWRIWKCAGYVFRTSRDSMEKALALGLMTGLVGLLFHGLGANTFIIVRIMEPFWFLVGLVAHIYVRLRKNELSVSEAPPAVLSAPV